MKIQSIMSIAMAGALACGAASCSKGERVKVIDKPEFTSADRVFTIEALEALGRVSSPQLSPDGKKILFGLAYESVEENKSNSEIYVIDADADASKEPVRLTETPDSETGAVWIEDGKRIAYMFNYTFPDDPEQKKSDGPQLCVMNADGTDRRTVSFIDGGIEGFLFSPDESKVLLIARVKYERTPQDIYPDLPKANAHIVDDLMYKHWDQWVAEIPHPFLADWDGKSISNIRDIMADEPLFEAPMRPWGGIESFAWTPDSKQLVYVSRKKKGLDYSVSTNSDLYLYDVEKETTRNLTEGMMGYDTMPVFSPDGSQLAWLSMEHDGYESDKNRIFVMDMATGEKSDLTADWDYSVEQISWSPDGKTIYFIAPYQGTQPLFAMDVESREVRVLSDDVCDYQDIVPMADGSVVTLRHSMLHPNEICRVAADGVVNFLTDINRNVFDAVDMPTVEKRMVPTTDGKQMTAWVIYPPHFDPSKKYPAVLYCQGGPQSPVSQFWSYRWNLALMASQGYIVIAPNRRGLPGFGTEWNAQISGDYPGQNMKDYLAAVDDLKRESYVDADHIGAVGASYGGFSVYWLAGNHDGRFACFIAHAGIFNMEAQYLETEEMWFANWDMGGAPWELTNATAQRTFACSPHKYVDKWDTPILVTHGEYDFRILASQGMMAFNAARLRGVPAEMVIFPDENHWILKPQNAILWQRVFFRWLDRWLKPAPQSEPASQPENV